MCIILSNSKRGQTSMLISYTMKEALSTVSLWIIEFYFYRNVY